MTPTPTVTCLCGKVHCAAGVGVTTRCGCGVLLWPQMVQARAS